MCRTEEATKKRSEPQSKPDKRVGKVTSFSGTFSTYIRDLYRGISTKFKSDKNVGIPGASCWRRIQVALFFYLSLH